LTLYDVNQAAAIIKETAHPDVNLIFGAVIDPNMREEVRITVIATGFERAGAPRRNLETPVNEPRHSQEHSAHTTKTDSPAVKEFTARAFNTEDLDIPTFLRNRKP
jgi:cell division protein FtsZ